MYSCSVCGKPVTLNDDNSLSRECEHNDATVIADMSATVYGTSSLNEEVDGGVPDLRTTC